ncbi:MAG: flagellar motor switch protein FliM [Rhodospirillum sp.]|nr:flagellar motor switch protein FliM [Rhodospirillum sp.]
MVPADEDPQKEVSPEDEAAMMAEWEAMMGADGEGDVDGGKAATAADGGGGGGDAGDAASEWESMLGKDSGDFGDLDDEDGAGGAAMEAGSTRVLNQEEIDSLLGFNEAEEASSDKSGIQAIISTALVSYERLPMLEVVFDRLVRMMSTSLRNFTSDNVEVSLDNIQSYRFGDYLNSIPLPAMLSVFKAEEWDNYGLLTIDSSMIYSIVDVLLGGRRGTAAMRIEGRPYTTIERNLVERLVHVVLADLSAAFDPLSPVTFRFDRLETNPRFATISRPSNAAIVAKLRIDMEDRGGRLDMLIPYATLEPVRELLLQMFMGEKFGRDSIWETHLAEEMWSTEVSMEAILDEIHMPLSKILNLRVGSQVMFNATPDSTVQLRCGDVPMFDGKMGRKGQNIAIRVDNKHQRAKS